MNEEDSETIAYRASQDEMQQLHALRDSTLAELQSAMAAPAPAEMDGAALVSYALAGNSEGAATVLQSAAASISRAAYLRSLLAALDNAIESQGFKVTRLMGEAISADMPRIAKLNEMRLAARRKAFGTFSDPVKLPSPDSDISSYH
jgi:hypothetical protein